MSMWPPLMVAVWNTRVACRCVMAVTWNTGFCFTTP